MLSRSQSYDHETKKKNITFLFMILPILCSLWIAILLFGNYLDIHKFEFMPKNAKDAHIMSLFFRQDQWHFPITITKNIAPPSGIPLALTNSIPILLLLFKLLSINTAQYFGFWIIICALLMAYFSYRIVKNIFYSPIGSGLGTLLFVFTPFYWYHAFYYPWLAGQWVILWAFSLFFKKNTYFSVEWFTVLFISTLIHPYFSLVNFFIALADLIRLYLYKHSISLIKTVKTFGMLLTEVIFIHSILGTFYLIRLSDPDHIFIPAKLSSIFLQYPSTIHTYDISYFYTGFGVIIGLTFGIMILRFPKRKYFKYYLPFVSTVGLFCLLAVFGGVAWNSKILINPIDNWLKDYFFGIFTSGPRFMFPLLWIFPVVTIQASRVLEKKYSYLGYTYLILMLIIQIYTFSIPMIVPNNKTTSPLPDHIQEILKPTDHIVWIFSEKDQKNYPAYFESIAYYAVVHNKTINAAPTLRFPMHYLDNRQQEWTEFQSKNFAPKTLYIIKKVEFPISYQKLGTIQYYKDVIFFIPFQKNL